MIIDSFDNISEAIITPEILFGEKAGYTDLAIGYGLHRCHRDQLENRG